MRQYKFIDAMINNLPHLTGEYACVFAVRVNRVWTVALKTNTGEIIAAGMAGTLTAAMAEVDDACSAMALPH